MPEGVEIGIRITELLGRGMTSASFRLRGAEYQSKGTGINRLLVLNCNVMRILSHSTFSTQDLEHLDANGRESVCHLFSRGPLFNILG